MFKSQCVFQDEVNFLSVSSWCSISSCKSTIVTRFLLIGSYRGIWKLAIVFSVAFVFIGRYVYQLHRFRHAQLEYKFDVKGNILICKL